MGPSALERHAALEAVLRHFRIEDDRRAVLDRERMKAHRRVERRELAHWARIDQLADREVQRGAFDAIRIRRRNAQPLRRLARLDLGAVVLIAVVIALRQAADVATSPFVVACFEASSAITGSRVCDELGHDLGDRAQA